MTIDKFQIEWQDRSGGIHQRLMSKEACLKLAEFLRNHGGHDITINHALSGESVWGDGTA